MEAMLHYTQGQELGREAGGIFLGSYRGVHIEITAVTRPLQGDRRERYRFDRNDPGHQAAAKAAWVESGKTTTFTGEWHTHPESNPLPSPRDLQTWRELIAKATDPLVFIILGWSSNWYGVGYRGRVHPAKPI